MSGKYKARKSCKHCSEVVQPNWRGISHEIVISDGALFYYDSNFGWEGISVNFCPFCGRQLADNSNIAKDKMEGFV